MAKVITLAQIAELTGGSVVGDPEIKISSISDPRRPKDGAISPLWEKKLEKFAAGCPVLFTKKGWVKEGQSGVELDEPRAGLIALLKFFDEAPERERTVSERALVDKDATLGENVAVGAGSVIKAGASVGDGTVIMENVFIDCGVTIGKNCVIEPGAVVFHHSVLGDRCVLHANAVVGCDGFGFVPDPKAGMVKIPQIGIAHLDDGVEIGAFSSVDRATFGETYIGPCTKIDSHVKIGHNCWIGGYTIIVAQSGIAGSSHVGSRVIMAAQSGAANHATIGDGCTVGGRAGVSSDIPAGAVVSGFPAQDHRKELRIQAAIRQLPEISSNVRDFGKRIAALEKRLEDENA